MRVITDDLNQESPTLVSGGECLKGDPVDLSGEREAEPEPGVRGMRRNR